MKNLLLLTCTLLVSASIFAQDQNYLTDPEEIKDLRITTINSYEDLQKATNITDIFPLRLNDPKWQIDSYQISVSSPGIDMMLFSCEGEKLCEKYYRVLSQYHSKDHTYGISNVRYKAGQETVDLGSSVIVVVHLE